MYPVYIATINVLKKDLNSTQIKQQENGLGKSIMFNE